MTNQELVGEINKAVTEIEGLNDRVKAGKDIYYLSTKLDDISFMLSDAADREFEGREIAKHLPGCNDYIDYVSVFKDIVEARKYWDTDSPLYYLARATEKLLDIVKANGKG